MKLQGKNTGLVYIIIVNWNGWKDTIECIKSLNKLKYKRNKIVIVDNDSKDIPIEHLKTSNNIHLIQLDKNHGYSYANNIGIKYALKNNAEYILLLNNDTIVSSNLLDEFIKIFKKYPKVGALAAKIYYYHDKKKIWFAGGQIRKETEFPIHLGFNEIDNGQFNKIVDTPFINGGAFFIKTAVIKKIGFLDDKYFYMYEDADWTSRIISAGYRCLFVPTAKIWHKVHRSTKGRSAEWWYYDQRSYLLWLKSHFPEVRLYKTAIHPFWIFFQDSAIDLYRKGILQFPKNLKRHIFILLAKMIGTVDYLKSYYGECPEVIKAWN